MAIATAFAAASVVFLLLNPPSHRNSLSSAESEMVRTARGLARTAGPEKGCGAFTAFGGATLPFMEDLAGNPALDLVLCLRTTSGLAGHYWEVTDAVLPPGCGLTTAYVGKKTDLSSVFLPGRRYLVFLDAPERIPSGELGSMSNLTPDKASYYAAWQSGTRRVMA